MGELAKKKCVACSSGTTPLKGDALKNYASQLKEGWKLVGEIQLEKSYTFKNFREALNFTNQIGEIAEEQGHHPDIFLAWGKVKVTLWTHKIKGLSENDFIMADKCDLCFEKRAKAA